MAAPPNPGSRPLRAASFLLLRALPRLAPTLVVVAMLACLLVPLPTPLLDLLLSLLLAGAVLLLVASLAIRRSAEFLAFPSLLLLVTLYRLTLNISTTRLILSQAYAGEVVEAFASLVVAGDLVVGGVMFVIITIVQFVVIARGSERVAEVAARFALDGLPGHQAAIDADLRTGVLSPSEASRRRAELGERSSFYGAMDGAARFVRGDAIAGLAIIAINLFGGVLIGITRLGMGWTESLQTFGRLTIGDGLLTQIPALVVSLAAGILVSRVDANASTASARPQWLHPAMLVVPAVLLFGLAWVPGMPRLAFGVMAVALVAVAMTLALASVANRGTHTAPASPRRITVHVRPEHVSEPRALERALGQVRLQCASALGIELPPVDLELDPSARPERAEIRLEGRRQAEVRMGAGSGEDELLLRTFRLVMDQAPSLLDLQELDRIVEQTRATHPVIVRQALAHVDLPEVMAVCRHFLRERIPLPSMRAVLGVLAEDRRCREPGHRHALGELVRMQLVDHWVHPVLDAVHKLGDPCFLRLTPDAEQELLDHVVVGELGSSLTLSRAEREPWHEALVRAVASTPDAPVGTSAAGLARRPVVLVATPRARQAAAALVADVVPHVVTLSTFELQAADMQPMPVWLDPP